MCGIDISTLHLNWFHVSTKEQFLHCVIFSSYDLQKVHTFQKSLEAVLQKLGEVEIGQNTLKNAGNIAGTENEILLFRNQLKVGFNHLHYY